MVADRKLQHQGKPRQKPRKLDLLFIHDNTGSQGPYIKQTIAKCKDVCYILQSSGQLEPGGLNLGLVTYRDHGDDYVVRSFDGLTSDVEKVVQKIGNMTARGGQGDGPEAVAAALEEAVLRLKWRPDAVKVAILIADAPPHGIGEISDNYHDEHPSEKDPLALTRAMARRGITLLVVACEPALSNDYVRAHDFYTALTKLTSGLMIPLTDAKILAPFLIGFTLEQIGIDSLVDEFKDFVAEKAKEGLSQDEIVAQLHEILKSRGQSLISVETTKGIYKEPPEAAQAVSIWMKAKTLAAGKKEILSIPSNPRVNKEFERPADLPHTPVSITLKNLGDAYIEYQYPEDGIPKEGVLGPNQISETPTKFAMNIPFTFSIRCGRTVVPTTRTFTQDQHWNLAEYFDSN